MKRILSTIFAFAVIFMTMAQNSDVPFVYDVENTGIDCPDPVLPSANQCKTVSKLPDPFEWSDGSGRIETFADWTCRRNEIKREIEHYEIGEKPKFDKLEASYSGNTLTVKIYVGSNSLTLTSKISIPSGNGPHPVVIGMDGNTGSMGSQYFSKCIQIPFTHSQIAEYNSGFGGNGKSRNDPFFKLYPNDFHKGDYCAWSWGISRLIGGLEIIKDQINADLSHIAVTGCSYAGKMALYAGAFDERIALTIAQESGGGGVNSWRVSEKIGSSVEGISNTNYDWFMSSFKTNFNGQTSKIPYDHHELIAMIAPRAFLAFGNKGYEWLGDESGYISCQAAFEVWKAMGIEDRFGYVFDSGHEHCQASSAQNSAADKFIKKFLYGDDSQDTNVRSSIINTDYQSWKDAWDDYELTIEVADLTAKISYPSKNSEHYSDLPLNITTAIKAKNGIENVSLYLDGELLSDNLSEPYNYEITTPELGEHTLYVVAKDKTGETITSDEVTFTVIERKIFRMEKNTILKIEAEEMPEQDGQYVGPYEENFDGIAYYANKDMTAAPVFFAPEEGTFIITLTGCADASATANLSLYIDDEKVGTYTWNSNTTKEISKEVEISGNNPHTLKLMMETDNGQSDAFVDYLTIMEKDADINTTFLSSIDSDEINFYPNPASEEIFITDGVTKVKLFDTTGRILLETSEKRINISNFDPGIYTIQLNSNNKLILKHLIIR
jgi:hypothetical protein